LRGRSCAASPRLALIIASQCRIWSACRHAGGFSVPRDEEILRGVHASACHAGLRMAAPLVLFACGKIRYAPGALLVISVASRRRRGWPRTVATGPIDRPLLRGHSARRADGWLTLAEARLALMFILYANRTGPFARFRS
jgi:hypothetical protein